MSALLEVRAISKSFRGLRAVHEASFEIPEACINALIGPNSVPTPPMIGPSSSSMERPMLKISCGKRLL